MNKSPLHITKLPLFHTPESPKEIEDWIEKFPPEERVNLTIVMGMTWNLLAELVEVHNKFGGDAVSTGDEKSYHTLITAEGDEPWEAHFGSYEYEEVQSETEELPEDTVWKIITTDHAQAAIDAEIGRLNERKENG